MVEELFDGYRKWILGSSHFYFGGLDGVGVGLGISVFYFGSIIFFCGFWERIEAGLCCFYWYLLAIAYISLSLLQ